MDDEGPARKWAGDLRRPSPYPFPLYLHQKSFTSKAVYLQDMESPLPYPTILRGR